MVDITVIGISLSQEGSPVVLLHPAGTECVLCLGVGPMEAFAISAALYEDADCAAPGPFTAEESAARFQTHDFMARMTLALGGKLRAVELMRVVGGSFTAEAEVATASETVRVDCRPSDGIALALRCGAPIRAARPVLEHGEPVETVLERLPGHVRLLAAAKLARLSKRRGRKKQAPVPECAHDPRRELLSAARKLLEEERAVSAADDSQGKEAPAQGQQTDRLIDESEFPGRQPKGKVITGQINIVHSGETIQLEAKPQPQRLRIALVRKDGEGGEAKVLEEFTLPVGDIPQEIVGTLTVGSKKEESVKKEQGSEEERWADLLRTLAPETKVPM